VGPKGDNGWQEWQPFTQKIKPTYITTMTSAEQEPKSQNMISCPEKVTNAYAKTVEI